MLEAAWQYAVGVLVGLYRCRDREDVDRLLSWAPDFPAEQAAAVVRELRQSRCRIPDHTFAVSVPEWLDALREPTSAET